MLDFLRRGVKSWPAKILLFLLILSFAVWGISDIFVGSRNAAVAHVGETEVDSNTFANALVRQQNLLIQRQGQAISLQDLRGADIDDRIIEGLIRDATYREELATLEIAIPPSAVRDTISSNPSFQDAGGNFSQYAYQSLIAQQQYEPREFEQLTANQLGQQVLADAVAGSVAPAPGIAEAITVFDGEKRAIATLRLAAADAEAPGEPSQSALSVYFDENGEQFQEPERRWGSYVHTDLAALAEELAPTDDEVRAEYDANPDAYTVPATRTIDQIIFEDAAAAQDAVDRLNAGTVSFEEIAAEQNISLDELSLGTVAKGELPEAVEEVAFAMTEPGFAGPIDGLFGLHVINVTGVEVGGLSPFEDVETALRARLATSRAQNASTERATQIEDILAGGASMEEISQETGLPLQRFEGLDAIGRVSEGDRPVLASDPLFMSEVRAASEEEERDLVELSDGSYVLVMVEQIRATHLPELDTIRDAVTEAWKQEQRLIAQETRGTELTTGGRDLETIGTELSQPLTEIPAFDRGAAPAQLSNELIRQIFDAEEGAILVGRARDGGAALLVELRGITPLDAETMEEQSTSVGEVLAGSMARDQLEYFARALEARHGAVISPGSIDTVFEQLGAARAGHGAPGSGY